MTSKGDDGPPPHDPKGPAAVKAAMSKKQRVTATSTLVVIPGGRTARETARVSPEGGKAGEAKPKRTRAAPAGSEPPRETAAHKKQPRQSRASSRDDGEQESDDDFGGATIPPDDLELVRKCANFDQNDRDNGRRLIIWFGLNLAYVPGMGWLVFGKTHWERDEGELQTRLHAQNLVDMIKRECQVIEPSPGAKRLIAAADAALAKPPGEISVAEHALIGKANSARTKLAQKRQKRFSFAVTSGNAGKTVAMITQAASLKAVDPEILDADLMQFNVLNGTLKFGRELDPEGYSDAPGLAGTVSFSPHDRADMITKCAAVAYDPAALCPEFLKFLERVQPEEKMRIYLQVVHGYALLIGGNDEQCLPFHYGTGANGKSAFIEAIGRLAGDYRAVMSPDSLTGESQRDGSKANSDIARLHSARLVTVEELPRGVALKENLIKALTGGTRQIARFLNKENFEFDPKFTAIMSGNDMPRVGNDYGIWRRLIIVEWAVTIPKEERTAPSELAARFDAERPGILNWLIEGVLLYLKHGLVPFIPKSVTQFTEDYREELDPVGNFVTACVIPDPERQVQAGALFRAYLDYCEANAMKPWSQTAFGNRMNALGFKKERGSHVVYVGVRLGEVPSKFDAVQTMRTPADDPGWIPPDR